MLLVWLRTCVRAVAWLFIPPPTAHFARIDPSAQCPACGVRQKHAIRCVEAMIRNEKQIVVQHTCAEDGARWYESPIVAGNAIHPAEVKP